MLNELKKNLTIEMFTLILFIILGILMIISPNNFLIVMNYIVSIGIILFGIITVIFAYKYGLLFNRSNNIVLGILEILLGIILITHRESIALILPIVLSIWMLFEAIRNIDFSFRLKDFIGSTWVLMLILGIVELFAACYIGFVNPFASSSAITIFAGIMVIVYAIAYIVDIITIKSHIKDVEKFIDTIDKK